MGAGRRRLSVEDHVAGVLDGDKGVLGRTITLVESSKRAHQEMAAEVLTRLMPHTGGALRVGITGVPGVGKSTFIEALGSMLTQRGHRLAVLAIDPSSSRSGGSILGDKTRMTRLSRDPRAFIRPSPSTGTLGGVAARTREAMLLCEAAGYDIVLVETVGVGQSETVVSRMTDFFMVLMLAGAGDALQGIKRGLMELADMLAINKADGDGALSAQRAAGTYRGTLQLLHPHDAVWKPPVLTCSALEEQGLEEVWGVVLRHRRVTQESGDFQRRRRRQRLDWLWAMVDHRLRQRLESHPNVQAVLKDVEKDVVEGRIAATTGSAKILEAFLAD
jgi:LAO/AO transport system kinase